MTHHEMGRVAAGQFLSVGSIGAIDRGRPQFLFFLEQFIVDLKLDEHIDLWPGIGIVAAIPHGPVKENILSKVLRRNETKFSIVANEADCSQAFLLNAKRFLGKIVVAWSGHRKL